MYDIGAVDSPIQVTNMAGGGGGLAYGHVVNERNTDDFSIWYKYDIEYIENWSLYLDLKIILKTPLAIFSKKIKGL